MFSAKELAYCFNKKNAAEHLAVRFAGKEAVMKALSGYVRPLDYQDIEIERTPRAAPQVHVKKIQKKKMFIQISLSHTKDTAVAVAIVYG